MNKLRYIIILLFYFSVNFFYGQDVFIPNEYGLIEDPGFITILKNRKYESIRAFECIDSINKIYIAKYIRNNKAGLISNNGKEILAPKYNESYIIDYTNPNKIVLQDTNGYFNIIDSKNKRNILSGVLMDMSKFKNGLSVFRTDNTEYSGIIDSLGNIIVSITVKAKKNDGVETDNKIQENILFKKIKSKALEYEAIDILTRNLFIVTKNGKKGLIDRTGQLKTPLVFSDIRLLDENLILAESENRSKKIMDLSLKNIINLEFTDVSFVYNGFEKLLLISNYKGADVYSSLYSMQGKEVFKYGQYIIESKDFDGKNYHFDRTFLLNKNNKYAIVKLNSTIQPQYKYDICLFKKRTYYYFLENGNILGVNENSFKSTYLPFNYFQLINFNDTCNNAYEYIPDLDEFIQVKKNKLHRIVNAQGKILSDYIYTKTNKGWYKSGIITVNINNKTGVLDTLGKFIYPLDSGIVDYYKPSELDVFVLCKGTLKNKKPFVVDMNGKTIIPVNFDDIDFINKNNFIGKKDNLYAIYDLQGKMISKNYTKIKKGLYKKYLIAKNENYSAVLDMAGNEIVKTKNDINPFDVVSIYNLVFLSSQ